MKRPEPDSPEAQRRSQAAAEWLVKHDRGLTAAEQDAFLDWLAADPRHGDWLALHRSVVADFNVLSQWRPEHSEEPNPDLLARAMRRHRWLAPAVLALAAAFVVAFLAIRGRADREMAPVAAGDLERRVLEDGSTIDLNRGAQVTVMFNASERRIALVRGEALFTVAPNAARPFIVQAGDVAVRAVGTAFNVRLAPAAVEVLVTHGQVQVQPPPVSAAHPVPLVSAGQRATVATDRAAPPQIEAVTPEQSARLLSWQPQLLDFSSAPLSVAVAEFNRRNRVQFVIEDPELAAMPIVASIRSDRVEGFAQFLAATPGMLVERRGHDEIVLRRKR